MTKSACGRSWEASAIEDGRLDKASVESFQRHLDTCSVCQQEVLSLRLLRDLAFLTEPGRLPALEQRRMRQRLLREAHAQLLQHPKRGPWLVAMVLAACATVTLVASLGLRHRALVRAQSEDSTPLAPVYEINPTDSAVWHEEKHGLSTRILLLAGTLAVHVEHLGPDQRFTLSLPDGELEVRGTRFVVAASQARTNRVQVTEGAVALRLAGAPEQIVRAGEGWLGDGQEIDRGVPDAAETTSTGAVRGDVDLTSPLTSTTAPFPHETRSRDDLAGAPEHAIRTAIAPRASIAAPGPPLESGPHADPTAAAADFVVAMSAFSHGDYIEADERFAEFAARYGGDTRAEDAAYLRTVIALRRGDRAAALVRARDYLNRFPRGLRRLEMERLLSESR